jgi:hypothetical protein
MNSIKEMLKGDNNGFQKFVQWGSGNRPDKKEH